MSLQALRAVAEETRRISVAGSALAPGDFRLKKLVEPLDRSGQKAPVFAKVAAAVRAVVEGDEASSGGHLLTLATLTHAILYTQGSTGVEGELEEFPESPLTHTSTRTSYRVLAPLIEALTSTGSGRLRTIEDAFERGAFNDLRLVQPALQALGDSYGEIAEFVAEKVVPSFGPGVLPLLRDGFDPKGGKPHARRLQAMVRIDLEGSRDVCREVVESGHKVTRLVAIEGLAGSAEDLPLLIDLAKDRSKDIRAAAFRALAHRPVKAAISFLKDALKGKDLGLLVPVMRGSGSAEIADAALAAGAAALDAIVAKQAEAGDFERLHHVLLGLAGRSDDGARDLLLRCLKDRKPINAHKEARDLGLVPHAVHRLFLLDQPAATRALIDALPDLPPEAVEFALAAAARDLPPDEVFKRFSPEIKSLKKRPNARQKVVLDALAGNFSPAAPYQPFEASRIDPDAITWSPKWLDLAIKIDQLEAVLNLAVPGHKKLERYLERRFDAQPSDEIVDTQFELGHPKRFDCCRRLFRHAVEKKQSSWQFHYLAATAIPSAPPADWPEIEKIAAGLPEAYGDSVRECIATLREGAGG